MFLCLWVGIADEFWLTSAGAVLLKGPNCSEKGHGCTTWKPMCRLPDCRKAARVAREDPSKYCSDEHGREFMSRKMQHLNLSLGGVPRKKTAGAQRGSKSKDVQADNHSIDGGDPDESNMEESVYGGGEGEDLKTLEELGSRGGALTAGELKAVVMGVSSAEEFRKLGERIISLPQEDDENQAITNGIKKEEEEEGEDGGDNENAQPTKLKRNDYNNNHGGNHKKKLGLDIEAVGLTYTADEAAKIEKLRKKRDELFGREEFLEARNVFLNIVRQRTKHVLDHLKQTDPKGGWKDICGFDLRLAWSDEEFDEWRQTPIAKKALELGTPDLIAASFPDVDDDINIEHEDKADGNGAPPDAATMLTRGICTKKRCERHKQWAKVQQQDIQFEQSVQRQDLAKCEQEAQAVVERAVLRMWAEMDNMPLQEAK